MVKRGSILGAVAGALLVACASAGPSEELVDARRAYDEANRSKAAELAPDDVLEARQALERAEAAHAEDSGSDQERNLAYIAHRKALQAIAQGEIREAQQEIAQAEKKYQEVQAAIARDARRDLDRARAELAETNRQLATVRSELEERGETLDERTQSLRDREQELAERKRQLEQMTGALASEREARERAEAAAAAALESLREVAKVKEEQRGVVITLSGGVLFETAKSELLPIARQKLKAVADALKLQTEDKTIVVEGHTDSRGSDQMNMQLSRDRAESVREYLVSQGVDASRIQVVGRGETMPIADNATAEGRANNRRVEIIVGGRGAPEEAPPSPEEAPPQPPEESP